MGMSSGITIGQVQGVINQISSQLYNATNQILQYVGNTTNQQNQYFSSVINSLIGGINSINSNVINNANRTINDVRASIIQSNYDIKNELRLAESRITNSIYAVNANVNSQFSILNNFIASRLADSVTANAQTVSKATNIITDKIQQSIVIDQQNTQTILNAISAINAGNTQALNNFLNNINSNLITQLNANLNQTKQAITSSENSIKSSIAIQKTDFDAQFSGIRQQISTLSQNVQQTGDIGDILTAPFKMLDVIGQVFSGLLTLPADIGKSLAKINEIYVKLSRNEYDGYNEFIADMNSMAGAGKVTELFWNIGKVVYLFTIGLVKSYDAFGDNIATLSRDEANSTLLTSEQILTWFVRFGDSPNEIDKDLRKLGYSDENVRRLKNIAFPILPAELVRFLWLNERITEDYHDSVLKELGYNSGQIHTIKESYFLTPSTSDLILMAVREAFSPEIAAKFGQYDDYPTKLTQYAKRNGLTEDWSKAFWAAHWKLPSAEQGFEMLHRKIISQDELELLLRANDVMPFWREKLIQLNYSPLRLVDIRNFYKEGVINREEMFKEYQSRGYDKQHAAWAVEYTIKSIDGGNDDEQTATRLLTQSVIVKAFNTGRFDRKQAIAELNKLKYSNEKAGLILDLYASQSAIESEDKVIEDNRKRIIKLSLDAYSRRLIDIDEVTAILLNNGYTQHQVDLELGATDYENELGIKQTIMKYFAELFVTYQVDEQQFTIMLSERGFSQGEVNRALQEYGAIRAIRNKMPTLDTFRRWFGNGVISGDTFIRGLKGLGYNDVWINYYVLEIIGGTEQ